MNDWTPQPQRTGMSTAQKVLLIVLIVVAVAIALGFNYFAGMIAG